MNWTRDDIDAARAEPLAPNLERKLYRMRTLLSGAALLADYRRLVACGNHWAWKAETLRGNTVDVFMAIEGATFAETMAILTANGQDARQD